MNRIVISGAGGFLGQEIIEKASMFDGPEIIAITSNPQKYSEYKNVSCIMTDEFLQKKAKLDRNDIFINCLFPMYADSEQLQAGSLKSNQMIQAARNSNVKALINISSQRVYGSKRSHPAKESDPFSPQTPYAEEKIKSENFCNKVFENIPYSNIRLSSLLGPDYSKQLVNRMISRALEEGYIVIKGGAQRFSYLDVRDAADALLQMTLASPEQWKSVYNLGNNSSYSLSEIASEIKEILASKGRYVTVVTNFGDDTSSSELDASLFINDFCWTPSYSLEHSISDIVDYQLTESNA